MTINEKVIKIMELALLINRGYKNTIFFEFYGHTKNFLIHWYKNGWSPDCEKDFYKELYLNDEDASEKLNEIITELEKLKED